MGRPAKDSPIDGARERILAAAERHFAEVGYERTTLEAIGAEVGVGRPAVLYHFKGKRELYSAVLAAVFVPFLHRVQQAASEGDTLRDRLHAISRCVIGHASDHPSVAKLASRELSTRSDDLASVLREVALPWRIILEDALERARDVEALAPDVDLGRFLAVTAGPILYHFTALPTLLGESDAALAAPPRIAALEADVAANIDRLFGMEGAP